MYIMLGFLFLLLAKSQWTLDTSEAWKMFINQNELIKS